jgi:hypothetical protein
MDFHPPDLAQKGSKTMTNVEATNTAATVADQGAHVASERPSSMKGPARRRICPRAEGRQGRGGQRPHEGWTPIRSESLLERWIPFPRVLHPYPSSPVRRQTSKVRAVCVNAPVRICAGAISDGRPYHETTRRGCDLRLVNRCVGRFFLVQFWYTLKKHHVNYSI